MDELLQYFSLDFLDALINEVLLSYPYFVETKRGINSMVYMIRDEEKVIGSITVKPSPSNDGVYRISYGLGTNNKLNDNTKMSAIQTNLYNRIVSEAYHYIFSDEFKDRVASEQSRPSHTTPPGLIGSAINTAQWVALNMTGDTKSLDTREILRDRDKTAEYVERMGRVEKGIYAISNTAVPKQPEQTVPTTLTLPQVGKLGKLISEWFSKGELRDLSFYLSLDYENLPSDTKDNMARELVNQARRENKVPQLWTKLHEERAHVDWSEALI